MILNDRLRYVREEADVACVKDFEHSSGESEILNRNFHFTAVCYICRLCSFVYRWIGNTTTVMTSARTFLEPGNTPVCRDCSIHAGGRTRNEAINVQGWRAVRTSLASIMLNRLMLSPDRKHREALVLWPFPFVRSDFVRTTPFHKYIRSREVWSVEISYRCSAFRVFYKTI
jgi:hypothetical protein